LPELVSTNLGWVVQQYIREIGWIAVTAPYPCQEEAEAALAAWYPLDPPARVYEAFD